MSGAAGLDEKGVDVRLPAVNDLVHVDLGSRGKDNVHAVGGLQEGKAGPGDTETAPGVAGDDNCTGILRRRRGVAGAGAGDNGVMEAPTMCHG